MHRVIQEDITSLIENNGPVLENFRNKSVLVTGSTGMIGQYLVYLLMDLSKQDNYSDTTVIAHARNESKAATLFGDYAESPNFHLSIGDVSELTDIEYPVDYVIHAASPAQPKDFKERPVDIITANAFSTYNLLNLCLAKAAHFCFTSSLEIYGEIPSDTYPLFVKESDYGAINSLDLRSSYPESKKLAENLCVAYRSQHGLKTTIARPAHTFGPGMPLDDGRVQTLFMKKALNGEELTLFPDRVNQRTYTYIADVAIGILYAIASSSDDEIAFNMANKDNLTSLENLARTIVREVGDTGASIKVIDEQGDSSMLSKANGLLVLDSSQLESHGWTPAYSLDDGIKRTLRYHTEA